MNAKPTLLEPLQIIRIDVPDELMGNAISQVQNKRGSVIDVESELGSTAITAKLPVAEMFGFEAQLKSATGGKGFYSTFYYRLGVPLVSCADVSPWAVQYLKTKGFEAWEWDIGKEPFPSLRCYSWVHCTQTLVHLIDEDLFCKACGHLVQVVALGGHLLVGDRFLPDCKINKIHIKYREVGQYILEFTKHNLKLIDVVPSFPLMGRLLLFQKV